MQQQQQHSLSWTHSLSCHSLQHTASLTNQAVIFIEKMSKGKVWMFKKARGCSFVTDREIISDSYVNNALFPVASSWHSDKVTCQGKSLIFLPLSKIQHLNPLGVLSVSLELTAPYCTAVRSLKSYCKSSLTHSHQALLFSSHSFNLHSYLVLQVLMSLQTLWLDIAGKAQVLLITVMMLCSV